MDITVKGQTDTIDDASNAGHTLSAMQTYHGAAGTQSNWRVSSATFTNGDNKISDASILDISFSFAAIVVGFGCIVNFLAFFNKVWNSFLFPVKKLYFLI